MRTILVTGVNGFVGNHLVEELTANGIRVIGIGGPGADNKNPKLQNYLKLNLSNSKEVEKISFDTVDGVIHLAGLATVGPSFDEPLEYINTNMGIEINLFEEAIKQDRKPRFLIISSGALYDPRGELPLTEESKTLPNSPYAVSKLGQETVSDYYISRGFDCIIARPFNHIGPGQGPGFIVSDLAKQIVEFERNKRTEITTGNLLTERDYTDVRDIVRAYRLLINEGHSGEVYNVCSGSPVSGKKILDSLVSLTKLNPPIKQSRSKLRPTDTLTVFGSHEKVTKDIGWVPEINLQNTLVDVMDYWRTN